MYASTREQELAATEWTDAQKANFLRTQFDAQSRYYREHYDFAEFCTVHVDGRPAGRLYVHRTPTEIRVVDIALLPAYRRRGIGERLLRRLFEQADAAAQVVTMYVEIFNPARALYARLGFRPIAEQGVYLYLRRDPLQVNTAS